MDDTTLARLDDAPLACGCGLGAGVETDPADPATDGTAGDEAAGLGAPPAPTVGGIPGAAAGTPAVREEGILTRAIMRCPFSQWPGTPLTK